MATVERDILGDPSVMKRLMAKTSRDGECLVFTVSVAPNGYGYLWDGQRPTGAHRVSYRVHRGPVPDGYSVCHTCDNRACVKPEHLFAASQLGNMQDMLAKGRGSHGPQHGALVSAGWTPEKRAKKAEQTRTRLAEMRAAARRTAGVPDGYYQCRDCLAWAPGDTFPQRPSGQPHSYCKICIKARNRANMRAYRARQRRP